MKKCKGITLVALVITIIILLILAGVTINNLTNNGILDKAKEALDRYNNTQDEEEMQIAKYKNEIGSYIGNTRDSKISYSTIEQVVGTWIDGKNIYQLTYTGNTPINAQEEFMEGDYDRLISLNGSVQHPNGNWMPIETNQYIHITLNSDNKALIWWNSDYLNRPCCITIRYTKTTE